MDDLPCLLVGLFDRPANPCIRSKGNLLGLIDHLGIEYQEQYRDPTYTEYFTGRLATLQRDVYKEPDHIWSLINQKANPHRAYGFCESLHNLTSAFQALLEYAKQATGTEAPMTIPPDELVKTPRSMSPFSLTSLSFCSIFGGCRAGWDAVVHHSSVIRAQLEKTRELFAFLFIVGPRTKHFCLRSNSGPLGINSHTESAPADGNRPTMTGHMHSWEDIWVPSRTPTNIVHEKPFSMCGRTGCSWRDGRCWHHSDDPATRMRCFLSHQSSMIFIENASIDIATWIASTAAEAPKATRDRWASEPAVRVGIYATPGLDEEGECHMSPDGRRMVLEDLQDIMPHYLGAMKDAYRLELAPVEAAPTCPACGTHPLDYHPPARSADELEDDEL